MPENIQFELDKLINNENYIVRIVLGIGNALRSSESAIGTVKGYLRQEFSVSANADYSSPFESSSMDKGNELLSGLTAASDMFFGTKMSSFRLSNILGSVAMWKNTKKPSFRISLIFVAIRPTDDVTKNIRLLMRAIYPSREGGGVLTKGPLGYSLPQVNIKDVTKDKGAIPGLGSAPGTSTVMIGKWFQAPGQLITNVDFSFSKEVISSGKPLYATAEVSFEPWRMLMQDEINTFFKF